MNFRIVETEISWDIVEASLQEALDGILVTIFTNFGPLGMAIFNALAVKNAFSNK